MKPVNLETVEARIHVLEMRTELGCISLNEEFELACLRRLFNFLPGRYEQSATAGINLKVRERR